MEFVKTSDSIVVNTRKRLPDNSVECLIKDTVNELILLPQFSFVTHGGFANIDGQTVAFLGESGVGKTTFAQKMQKDCYNDERVIIGIRDSKVKVWNYPFGGREGKIYLRPIEQNLSMIIFLRKGNQLMLNHLSKFEATHQLIRCTTHFDMEGFFSSYDYYKCISKILNIVPSFYLFSRLSDTQSDIAKVFENRV